jgi:hypothetical protein
LVSPLLSCAAFPAPVSDMQDALPEPIREEVP